jgi:hypothetical protein
MRSFELLKKLTPKPLMLFLHLLLAVVVSSANACGDGATAPAIPTIQFGQAALVGVGHTTATMSINGTYEATQFRMRVTPQQGLGGAQFGNHAVMFNTASAAAAAEAGLPHAWTQPLPAILAAGNQFPVFLTPTTTINIFFLNVEIINAENQVVNAATLVWNRV